MPRKKLQTREEVVVAAMHAFWHHGYEGLSMDHLIKATKANRQAIYKDFGGKRALFLACLAAYQSSVVSPAFEAVEAEGAGLAAIENYFETQISLAEQSGLPGPGCLVANTMTEIAPHDADIHAVVEAHNDRLKTGFLNALNTINKDARCRTNDELEELAFFLTVSAQGLWSASRGISSATTLRTYARNLVFLLEAEINR